VAIVLVVDDAQTDRELMARVITAAGHRVVLASDGKEAISLAMPVMDGFATCRNLSRDPETSAIPVVLVTSKQSHSDVFWGKRQGASDHIGKPWDEPRIAAMLARYCP